MTTHVYNITESTIIINFICNIIIKIHINLTVNRHERNWAIENTIKYQFKVFKFQNKFLQSGHVELFEVENHLYKHAA